MMCMLLIFILLDLLVVCPFFLAFWGLRLVILTKLWSMNFIGFPVVEIRLYFPLHCSLISVRKVFEQI